METTNAETAAAALGQRVFVVEATTEREVDSAFAALVARKIEALFFGSDTFFLDAREQIAGLAARVQ